MSLLPVQSPALMHRPGSVVLIDGRASVQFSGDRGFAFRVIRVDDKPTYEGWAWLDGYVLDRARLAVQRRQIFVQVAGLRSAPVRTPGVGSARRRGGRAGSTASAVRHAGGVRRTSDWC